jgi:hypothetical protein
VARDPQDGSTFNRAVIDQALRAWRQGDCVIEPLWFAFRVSPSGGITEAARAALDQGVELAEEEVSGFVVVTQTCDIVRSCADRPYIEVCPLVEVSPAFLNDVKKARRPGFALIPTLERQGLVADLDRVMTAEKSVVAQWKRVPGWETDAELRAFSAALARKRARFAFPDDFVHLMKPLQDRLTGKHAKHSLEGRALRELREIRVAASPSWDAARVSLMFYFIPSGDDQGVDGVAWAQFLEAWLDLVPARGRFHEVFGQVTTLDGLTAADYVGSDPLDLDHLTPSKTTRVF